ncbi:hypothetical protein U1Q18_042948, partial [Sarracenia purpurea var. burkii]
MLKLRPLAQSYQRPWGWKWGPVGFDGVEEGEEREGKIRVRRDKEMKSVAVNAIVMVLRRRS